MLDLKPSLNLVVEGFIAKCVAFVGFAFLEVFHQQESAPVSSRSYFKLVLASEEVLIVLSLTGILLLFGRKSEQEVLVAAVPIWEFLCMQTIDKEATKYIKIG